MNRARLSTQEVVDIRKQHRAGYRLSELASAYGRTVRTIGRVVSGESYGHIDGDAIDAAPPLPRNINWSGVTGRRSRTNTQDTPRVRHAPAEAPTTITHLGSAKDGPRCGATVLNKNNEYVATIEEIEKLHGMGGAYCPDCAKIGLDERRRAKADFNPMPSYGGRLP